MSERIGAPLEEQLKSALGRTDAQALHHELNGKQTPDLIQGKNVFAMESVPSDVAVHPATAALEARARRRAVAESTGKTTEVRATALPQSGEIFAARSGIPKPRITR